MENDKELVQKLFDDLSAQTGIPRIDLTENDSAALPFGEGMLLHVHYRGEIPEVDFTVPIGSVPKRKKASVYERLLAANFYWVSTQGATLSYQNELDEVIIQFREDTANLNVDRLQRVLEGFLSVAIKWKKKLAKMIENADDEDDTDEDEDHDLAAGNGQDAGGMVFYDA